jgi:hypothetical protein
VEYRRAFGPVFRGSIAWIDEGDPMLVSRTGVAAQAWLEPGFYGDRFTLGLGFGAYIADDNERQDHHGTSLSRIFTMTASYRAGRDWVGRFSWSRIASSYDRDTDLLMLGVGYRF